MTFAFKMMLRLAGVVSICLALGILWIMYDAARSLREDVSASTERVAWIIQDRTRFGGGDAFDANGFLLAAAKVMSPGICVDFSGSLFDGKRICSGWGDIGPAPPDWFEFFFQKYFYRTSGDSRAMMQDGRQIGFIAALPDPGAITRRAWTRVRLVAFAALVMTAATALLALLAIGQALLPARSLIVGLRRLQGEDYAARLAPSEQPEFRRISEAFNDLADRLEHVSAERTALTRRLFQVQEAERRALARELHDEFGQCLTSIGALAASIEVGAPPERSDLTSEAGSIAEIVARMTTTLRSALERLRPPELDSMGLEGSIRHLMNVLNRRFAPRVHFRFEPATEVPDLAEQSSVAVYRIIQECVTNAIRHGQPSEVTVRLGRVQDASDLLLVVEDDGNREGRPWSESTEGYGILGMHERVAALGGHIDLGRSEHGFKVTTTIPT